MSMMFMGLGLRDGGGWAYAGVEGIPTNGWVESFGVEVFEMDGVIRPGHWVWHCRSALKDLDAW